MTQSALKPQISMTPESIPFIDLKAQQLHLKDQIDRAIQRVLDHGLYIMGPEVSQLESRLSSYTGARHTITCANGTDALLLVLRARHIGPGDAIFVPSFTFVATAEVVSLVGATPVFVDILPDTFNMCPKSLEQAIAAAKKEGLTPKGVIPVDLFGLPADYTTIHQVAEHHTLWVMADGAQSFGAGYKGTKVGKLANVTTTSFFPAKPLGAYGDGGAIFTDDEELTVLLKSIRVHGQGHDRYHHINIGLNSRLDTFQAAILLQKLSIFDKELEDRQRIACRYNEALEGVVEIPQCYEETQSAWAQYTIKLPTSISREVLIVDLKECGIPTMVYYPIPLHHQPAYTHFPRATGNAPLPISEAMSQRVLSLPMHPYLTSALQDQIIESFLTCLKRA